MTTTNSKLTLCLDFDGVLHSYRSGWQGPDVIADPPVPRAMIALAQYVDVFDVVIFSSRSQYPEGLNAMKRWITYHARQELYLELAERIVDRVRFVTVKPPAHLTIDDRAWCFDGVFPEVSAIKEFTPWNR